jgi:Transposase
MLADELDYVVGVDTHRDRHTLAVVAAPHGGVVAQRSVRTNARGYAEAVRFAEGHAPGARLWTVEGAGHYGAGLARHLSGRGETVVESGRGPRDERRLRGKDDPLDAIRAARAALASETLAVPRVGRRREALRLLLVARRGAIEVRRRALVQLRSVIVTGPGSRPCRAGDAARTATARTLQPLPPLELLSRRRAGDEARPAHARTPDRGRDGRGRAARARDPRPRPRACTTVARRARCRPDRCSRRDRCLVAPRPRPLRGRLRPARRRRTRARL